MKKDREKYQTEEQKEDIKFVIVVIILVAIIMGVYLLSKVLIKPDVKEYEYTAGEVSDSAMSVGTILKGKEDEYYVLAFDSDEFDSVSYSTIKSYYENYQEEPLKVYIIDLKNALNRQSYVKENSNPNAKTVKDLKIKSGTLIKVSKGKIVKYLEGYESISKELKVS